LVLVFSTVLAAVACVPPFWAQSASAFAKSHGRLACWSHTGEGHHGVSRCHEARIIVQQRLSKAAWTKEVDKMTKWGALVDPSDRDALIDYLSTNFAPDQPRMRRRGPRWENGARQGCVRQQYARKKCSASIDNPRGKRKLQSAADPMSGKLWDITQRRHFCAQLVESIERVMHHF